MKKIAIIFALLLAQSAHAIQLDKCFNTKSGRTVGRIIVDDRSAVIIWDIKSTARMDREGGMVSNIVTTENKTSLDAYLSGVGDGSDVRIEFTDASFSLQGMTSSGELIGGKPDTFRFVKCR